MERQLYLIADPDSGSVVCNRAEVADTMLSRLFGLLGRPPLAEGQGLLIDPSSGVHTWGMSFPIDIVALDRDFRVARLRANTPPWRLGGISLETRSVLELPSGQIARSRIAVGHTLTITILP